MALSPLGQRVATAGVIVPLVLAALWWLPPVAWALVLLVLIGMAAMEWSRLALWPVAGRVAFTSAIVAAGLALLFVERFGFDTGWPDRVVLAVCGAATAFWFLGALPWLASGASTQGWPMACAGAVVLLGAWVALVEMQARSPLLVLAAMAVVWIADTAAYFAGRRWGRRKLAPSISPGKTWEGVGGALAAVAMYALLLAWFAAPALGFASPAAVATMLFTVFLLSLAAVSIVGDLFESMMKRRAGVKDSGSLLPGHGGVLDRVDALLAAMPPAALFVVWFLARRATG